MALSTAFVSYPKVSLSSSVLSRRPFHFHMAGSFKSAALAADTSSLPDQKDPGASFKSNTWQWTVNDQSVKIYYEEHGNPNFPSKKILMLPTISSVSTVQEWRSIAREIVQKKDAGNWHATIVDWPGMGFSDRPKLDYNSDLMEAFLADFIDASDGPLRQREDDDLVIFGAGHATTLLLHAANKGLVKPAAVAAVAPTWAGPFPIIFGRDSTMESRYGMFRGAVRAPYVGWMAYKMLISNASAVEKQFKAHVYADASHVTPEILSSRYQLTQRPGARYAPAAFLTGLMDPVKSREEFLELYATVEGAFPVVVLSSSGAPARSKAEMEALRGAKGVAKYVEVPGALLPQEEYPHAVEKELREFLLDVSQRTPIM